MQPRVAILYQALPPRAIGGLRKKPRKGGYAEFGADIGYALQRGGVTVVTPAADAAPNAARDLDWVFPDTEAGLLAALAAGANMLWTNTTLFAGHPVELVMDRVRIVGQLPADAGRFDDKHATNQRFIAGGLPTAASFMVGLRGGASTTADFEWHAEQSRLDSRSLALRQAKLPLVVKPVRGRGSEGVVVVATYDELNAALAELLHSGIYGDAAIVEQFLPGQEITISIMPPGSLLPGGRARAPAHWALCPVVREGQHRGVMPWNGDVPVWQNSRAMDAAERASPPVRAAVRACEDAAQLAGARGLVRIDCRMDSADGTYRIFDFNMKPALSGPGRPGREHEASLTSLAASADGLSFTDLLKSMLASSWTNGYDSVPALSEEVPQ